MNSFNMKKKRKIRGWLEGGNSGNKVLQIDIFPTDLAFWQCSGHKI